MTLFPMSRLIPSLLCGQRIVSQTRALFLVEEVSEIARRRMRR